MAFGLAGDAPTSVLGLVVANLSMTLVTTPLSGGLLFERGVVTWVPLTSTREEESHAAEAAAPIALQIVTWDRGC